MNNSTTATQTGSFFSIVASLFFSALLDAVIYPLACRYEQRRSTKKTSCDLCFTRQQQLYKKKQTNRKTVRYLRHKPETEAEKDEKIKRDKDYFYSEEGQRSHTSRGKKETQRVTLKTDRSFSKFFHDTERRANVNVTIKKP